MLIQPDRKQTKVEGIAKTGQIAPQGTVAHTEDWEGRIESTVGRSVLRLIMDPDGTVRPMTMREMLDRGYFHIATGPVGIRSLKEKR